MIKINLDELVALTVEDGVITRWEASEYSGSTNLRVFVKDGKKIVLTGDGGYWWKQEAKEAAYCEYAQLWMGEFPYGSWAWSVRRCKVTGDVKVESIETSINCRGLSDSDAWEKECRAYVPESVLVS